MIAIRSWRVVGVEPYGVMVWCDPRREHLQLHEGPWKGSELLSRQHMSPGVDVRQLSFDLDRVLSVSAFEPEPDLHAVYPIDDRPEGDPSGLPF